MPRRLRTVVLALLASPLPGLAAQPQAPPARAAAAAPEQAVVDALRANPLILPYSIRVTTGRSGEIILSGRVGTKAVHDLAIRTVIDLGLVPHDDLTIDTSEAHRVAAEQTYAGAQAAAGVPLGPAPTFVYPEPLFGRLDDPFWGFEPPIVSFPPRLGPGVAPAADPQVRRAGKPVNGQLQLTVDEFGQVSLSGLVGSEEDKRLIEQEAMSVPGVTRVASDLQVVDRRTPPPPPRPVDGRPVELDRPVPPPPPPAAEIPAPPAEAAPSAPARARGPLAARVQEAIRRRPALAGLPIEVQIAGGVATLSGKVPSAYEDMMAFRAVQQTAGVREVDDRLEFPLPDEDHPNPLRSKGRPDDLEPYLLHQVRRHVGDSAHVDRVRVKNDAVQVRGVLAPGEAPARLEALLRSIPLLREFRVEADFSPE